MNIRPGFKNQSEIARGLHCIFYNKISVHQKGNFHFKHYLAKLHMRKIKVGKINHILLFFKIFMHFFETDGCKIPSLDALQLHHNLLYKVKRQYVHLYSTADTSIKHTISLQSTCIQESCIYTCLI